MRFSELSWPKKERENQIWDYCLVDWVLKQKNIAINSCISYKMLDQLFFSLSENYFLHKYNIRTDYRKFINKKYAQFWPQKLLLNTWIFVNGWPYVETNV